MEGWDGDEGSTFMCEQCGLNIDDWKTSDCKGRLNGKYYKFKYCPECGRKVVFTLEKNAKYMQ